MRGLLLTAILALGACGGGTGSALISFTVAAGGPADAVAGSPLAFQNALGWQVSLTRARIHVGAVYLTTIEPSSGVGEQACTLPSGQTAAYVAEDFAPSSAAFDMLSSELVPFPGAGEGIALESKTAQVWLTGGDVNALIDPTTILDVAGTATKGSSSIPFSGTLTISQNRAIAIGNAAEPGSNPICQQRIVQPIQFSTLPTPGGILQLRIDPRPMFQALDFSTLPLAPGSNNQYVIPDTSSGAGQTLFKGMLSVGSVYQFAWVPQ
jgi:hypothetical protein